MARFLKEYAGTHWTAWSVIVCLLLVPFFSARARKLSILWLQIANFVLTCVIGAGLVGTVHSMTGDVALLISTFYGFGIGYSVLALRRKEASEWVVGAISLAAFGLLLTKTVMHLAG